MFAFLIHNFLLLIKLLFSYLSFNNLFLLIRYNIVWASNLVVILVIFNVL